MKTSHKHLQSINQNVLIFVAIIITLFGLSLKAHAVSEPIKSDTDLIKNSIKLQLINSEFSILIPRVLLHELDLTADAVEGQLTYVTDTQAGFYQYSNNQWSKVDVVTILKIAQEMLSLATPSTAHIILTEATNQHSNLLDYNGHVMELNKLFNLNEASQNFATHKSKD